MRRAVRFTAGLVISLIFIFAMPRPASAQMGDMGFFGGFSEGRRLMKTTEILLAQSAAGAKGQTAAAGVNVTLEYTELSFLAGRPFRFDGLIEVRPGAGVAPDTAVGTFTAGYRVFQSPGATAGATPDIARTMNFNVTYRVENTQRIYDYDVIKASWSDVITSDDGTVFTLDPRLSSYTISIIEDRTPGVSYYRGDFSGKLVYNSSGGAVVTANQWGSFHGFSCAWSSTETHRMNVTVDSVDGANRWSLQYEIRPSVTVNKILQYAQNEPNAISFEGNYKEVLQNFSGLKYDIYVKPPFMWDEPDFDTVSISSVNTFEQLTEPDLAFMKGNAAEDNIRRLYAMQVLTGGPRYFLPTQVISRGQFMTALAKAVKLPIVVEQPTTRTRKPVTTYLFSDVSSARPEFPYIMAIYRAGIAYGRENGSFEFDKPIRRQEAFASLIRALGLSQLGDDPTNATFFTDDDKIETWAKREISVAYNLGLIQPDSYGRINPAGFLTKGEAAELLNILIEFMRTGLSVDYADQIVNIAR